MKKQLPIIILLFFSSNLFAQTPTYFGADYSGGKVFIMENNKIVWEHPAPESNDISVLASGNLLFTTGHGVLELNRKKDTLFCYQSSSAIFACQRLKNGNTFVGECNSGRLLEITSNGTIVKEVCILPKGVTDGGHAFMRNARRLDNGNFLVAHYGSEYVKEYNSEGKEVWSVKVLGGPHSVIRLDNGNTLVSVADKTQNPRIIELNKKGEITWEFSNADLPNKSLKFLGGMHYLSDGRLFFSNWVGHEDAQTSIHLFCVTRDKKVSFTQMDHKGIKTISSVFVIL